MIEIESLVAIDVHTHAEISGITDCGALSPELMEAAERYFAAAHIHRPTVTEMAEF